MHTRIGRLVALFVVVACAIAAGCGGGGGGGSGSSAASPFTLSPADGSALPDATVGSVYSQSFTIAAGGNSPYTIIPIGVPPGLGITQNGNVGTLSGTPTQAGSGFVVFEVRDSGGLRANQAYVLTVQPASGSSITFAPATLPVATRGVQYLQNIQLSGATLPVNWAVQGNLPSGVNLGSSGTAQNTLSGVPTSAGTYNFTILVSDNSNPVKTGSMPYTLTVQNP